MLKIVANVSKKVPIPGLDYSSQSFMAGIEVEVSDGSTAEQLQHRIREVYGLLEQSVDAEIREYGGVAEISPTSESPSEDASPVYSSDDPRTRNGHSHGNTGKPRTPRLATQAQQKAVFAIAKAQGLDRKEILARIQTEFGVTTVEELSLTDASHLIDTLKTAS